MLTFSGRLSSVKSRALKEAGSGRGSGARESPPAPCNVVCSHVCPNSWFLSLLFQGDSGSPLVCESDNTWTQVGLVSWGINCDQVPVPSVYTDITEYNEWVRYVLSQASRMDSMGVLVLYLSPVLHLALLVAL